MVTDQDLKEYYNQHHQELGEQSWRPPEAFPWFLDQTGVQAGDSVLDIGCGTGYLLQTATQRGAETWGLDISEEAVALAGKAAPEADLRVGSAEALPFEDQQFDHVFCLGAMEHFADLEKGLREMIRVAKPGGKFCIVLPNSNYLYWKFKRMKGTQQQDVNERLMNLQEWKRVFAPTPLRLLDVKQDRDWFLRKYPVKGNANPVRIARALFRKCRWGLLTLNLTYQFVFLLEKPGG